MLQIPKFLFETGIKIFSPHFKQIPTHISTPFISIILILQFICINYYFVFCY
jgi:hypothetical protein